MKIVAILGSPMGTKGNTGVLLDIVLQGARCRGIDETAGPK
jgi:multimeric flavodoxin WrbA